MRIAVLEREGDMVRSGRSGDAGLLLALLSEWKELDHHVSVFRLPTRDGEKSMWRNIEHLFSLLVDLLSGSFDSIYLRSESFLSLGLLLRFLKRSSGIVVSWSRSEGESGTRKYRRLAMVADRIALSSGGKESMVKDRYGASATILTEAPIIASVQATEALHAFGLRERHYILFASNAVKRSDLLCLVKAFRDLEETGKLPNNFKLVILGPLSFALETEPYLQSAIGKRESILFLGEQSGQARHELFSHAGIFVQPIHTSYSERLLEALGYALPIVAGDSIGNRDILGDAGEYFESSESLRDTLSSLLIRPEVSSELCEAARMRFREFYSPKSDAIRLLELFEEAIYLRAGCYYSMNRTERHV